MSKTRQAVVALVICVLSVACLISLCRPQCKRPTLGSWLGISGPSFSWPSIPSAPSLQTANCKLQTSLFGPADDYLDITVLPSTETTHIRVTPDLVPHFSDSGSAHRSSFIVHRSLIRFRPSLHLSVLFEPLAVSRKPSASFAFGLKIRPVEVGRFGLAGYVTSKGPGAGLDCRLLGNLSADAVCLWRVDKFTPLPVPLTPALYLGISLRL